jgi:hypothetical protein
LQGFSEKLNFVYVKLKFRKSWKNLLLIFTELSRLQLSWL